MITWRCTVSEIGASAEVSFDPDTCAATIVGTNGERAVVKGTDAIELLATFTTVTRIISRCLAKQEAS